MNLLLDPDFWRPRLERLDARPRHLAIYPRADMERPGIEVLELRLRAHDGKRLTALLARSAFAQIGATLRVRPCRHLGAAEPDWQAVENGESDLVFRYPEDDGPRRLEDRVLDVLRVVRAACSIESIECDQVVFCGENLPAGGASKAPPPAARVADAATGEDPRRYVGNGEPSLPDEFAIARCLRSRGWV